MEIFIVRPSVSRYSDPNPTAPFSGGTMHYLEVRKNTSDFKDLEEQVRGVVGRLAELADKLEKGEDAVSQFLEGALDVRRYQHLSSALGKGTYWETDYYEFCVAWGGPNIYVRTDGVVEGYWGSDALKVKIEDEKILDLLEEVHDYMEDVSN